MNHSDAEREGILRRTDHGFLAVHKDLAFIREVNAREHVHECCFAAAVLAKDRKDLSLSKCHTDPVVGDNFPETLGDAPELDCVDCVLQIGTSLNKPLQIKTEKQPDPFSGSGCGKTDLCKTGRLISPGNRCRR